MQLRKYLILLPILALVFASIACSSSASDNNGKKIGDATSAPTSAVVTKPESYQTGDIIEVKDHTITLNGGTYAGSVLKLNFSVTNTGSEDLNLSSLMSFEAKLDDGTKLEQEIFDCGTSLDGKILPGDKLKGDLCYKMPAPGKFKVYYSSSLFASGAVVWELDTATLTPPSAAPAEPASDSPSTVPSYQAGDVIELNGQRITLNSAAIAGDQLKANLTIENTSAEDLNISSLMLFSAKNPDGVKLEQDIFDCGSAMLDGTVLPGDKIKGDICWKAAGATTAKIYYEATLFGSGAVVWEIK